MTETNGDRRTDVVPQDSPVRRLTESEAKAEQKAAKKAKKQASKAQAQRERQMGARRRR